MMVQLFFVALVCYCYCFVSIFGVLHWCWFNNKCNQEMKKIIRKLCTEISIHDMLFIQRNNWKSWHRWLSCQIKKKSRCNARKSLSLNLDFRRWSSRFSKFGFRTNHELKVIKSTRFACHKHAVTYFWILYSNIRFKVFHYLMFHHMILLVHYLQSEYFL